jgi:hypothetical protein
VAPSKKRALFSPDVRELIIDRCKGRCELCGIHTDTGQFHHRNPRRMGGTRRESLGKASNSLYLHQGCHERVESNRHEAYVNGWLLYADDEPNEMRVKLWDGWYLLSDDGSLQSS